MKKLELIFSLVLIVVAASCGGSPAAPASPLSANTSSLAACGSAENEYIGCCCTCNNTVGGMSVYRYTVSVFTCTNTLNGTCDATTYASCSNN